MILLKDVLLGRLTDHLILLGQMFVHQKAIELLTAVVNALLRILSDRAELITFGVI